MFWIALMWVGCVGDVGEGKVAAVVEEAPTEKAEKAKVAKADTQGMWPIDMAKSKVTALGAKITATHPIVFHDYSGHMTVSNSKKLTGLSLSVDMGTLEADHPKLTKHLKTDHFFDVEKHTHSTFESTAIVASDKGFKVTGDLTIRGATKRVSFPATVAFSPGWVTAKTEFTINRTDFGITYPGKADDLIQDNVVLTMELTGQDVVGR
jgi:polyisoprenoid-binding protein YceI